MITASFKYTENNRTIHGQVTLKDDGKTSISLYNSSHYSYSYKWKAKALANEIVKANFNHPSATDVKRTSELEKSLLTELLKQTSDFKDQMIEITKQRAISSFDYTVKDVAMPIEEWFKRFNIEYTVKQIGGKDSLVPVSYNAAYYKMESALRRAKDIVNGGFEKFESDRVAMAIDHYENSTKKLAYRLSQKGFDIGFEINSVRLGQNIEMTITKGDLKVRAWTIIAEGEVQTAHFRYLIK